MPSSLGRRQDQVIRIPPVAISLGGFLIPLSKSNHMLTVSPHEHCPLENSPIAAETQAFLCRLGRHTFSPEYPTARASTVATQALVIFKAPRSIQKLVDTDSIDTSDFSITVRLSCAFTPNRCCFDARDKVVVFGAASHIARFGGTLTIPLT